MRIKTALVIITVLTALLGTKKALMVDYTKNDLKPHHEANRGLLVEARGQVELVQLTTNRPEVEVQIREVAKEVNFEDVDYLIALANCESRLNPYAVNFNTSKNYDRGLYQFNSYWQRRVSDECAFDLRCSTLKTIEMIKSGQQHLWSCDKKI